MLIGHGINERLPFALRIEVLRYFLEHGLIEPGRHYLPVEHIHVQIQVIRQFFSVQQLAGNGMNAHNPVALLIMDPLHPQLCHDIVGLVLVAQETIYHCFTVGIGKYGVPEYFNRLQRRCGREPDLHGIKIVDHHLVLAEVIAFIPVQDLRIGHLFIEQIAPVGFIDDDEVILTDGHAGAVPHHVPHHALHSRDLHLCIDVKSLFFQVTHTKNACERQQLLNLHVLKFVICLFA